MIKIMAKNLSNTLFAKEESGGVRHEELMLIHCTINSLIPYEYPASFEAPLAMNLGVIFADVLAERKFRGHTGPRKKKIDNIGSFLTSIFEFHGVARSPTDKRKNQIFMDIAYFEHCMILLKGRVYRFYDRSGRPFYST